MENQERVLMKIHGSYKIVGVTACVWLFLAALLPFAHARADNKNPVIPPLQVTAETEPVLDMAVSADGGDIVYVTGGRTRSRLWISSADTAVFRLPRELVSAPSAKRAPALSPDGKHLAYVDTRFDAKGDIFLLNLKTPDTPPVRLTGRDTADDMPVFSADGRRIFFNQAESNGQNHLAILDPGQPQAAPKPVNTGGDGMSAAVSPDGHKLAFISFRADAGGDVFVHDLTTKNTRQITSGPAIDRHPAWGPDGTHIYFSRIDSDTNQDGRLSPADNSVICRIAAEAENARAWPLTQLNHSAIHPRVRENRLFYLSDRAGVTNCRTLPAAGRIPAMDSARTQLELARKLADRFPAEPYPALLAYYRVLETFAENAAFAAEAGCAVGEILERLHFNDAARQIYAYTAEAYPDVTPEGPLAHIRKIRLEGLRKIQQTAAQTRRMELLDQTIQQIEAFSAGKTLSVRAPAAFAKTRLMIRQKQASAEFLKIMQWLDPIIANDQTLPAHMAQALFFKAGVYEQAGIAQTAETVYRRLLRRFPDQRPWTDDAVERLLDVSLAEISDASREMKINRLRRMAEESRTDIPMLAMAAFNRIGDLYYAAGDRESAKSAYQIVIDSFAEKNTPAAAARFSLAELLYQEERFRQALDLYEKEISQRPSTDRIYQLARNGYIRKTASSGEFLYRLGEIPSARNTFKELIDYDETIIPAHRGYIKCAAAAGDIKQILADYRRKLEQHPNEPIWLYTTGLALTYLETEETVEEARDLVEQAVRLNGHVEYFHQTLGYIYEVSETVYDKPEQLERALESYKMAYFLNDPDVNPENAANLELNIGNAFYLLGQYGKGLEFYAKRLDREAEFSDPNTEIVFYKRLGECAFQARAAKQAKTAYNRALEKIDERMDPLAAAKGFDRLITLKTEMTDRLGLVCQELEDWECAVNAFRKAFDLNQKQGLTRNLAGNRRAVAYNTYHQARTFTGAKRRRLLETAAEEFQKVPELVNAHGVPKPEKEKKKKNQALFDISFQTALDTAGATEAAHGFSEVQEKRLAETFIARIRLELGDLAAARAHIDKQLDEYPMGDTVSENDRYGVALLYHRAGLLAHAMDEPETAFDRFAYSAELCLKMQAPVSAAMNLTNMAAGMEAMHPADKPGRGLTDTRIKRFEALEGKTRDLLEASAATRNSLRLAEYHNRMGVAYAATAGRLVGAGADAAVKKMNRLTRAAGHFTAGLKLCGQTDLQPAREAYAVQARLNLNLAALAHQLKESQTADKHFENALSAAEEGVLPDFKWRALAGLGRLEAAFSVLQNNISPARAGCQPMEILNPFSPLVFKTLKTENPEAAFNLAEQIAELERFNRTAEHIQPAGKNEAAFYESVYPRLLRIHTYQTELDAADPDKKPYIKERLDREKSLLTSETENLPDLIRQIKDKETQHRVMMILGASLRAEKIADQLAAENQLENPDPDKLSGLRSRYEALISTSRSLPTRTQNGDGPITADFMDFLRPRPAEAMDVMDALGEDEAMLRIFPTGRVEPSYMVFIITPESLSVKIAKNMEAIRQTLSEFDPEKLTYIAYEAPLALDPEQPYPQALSGTHLYRCLSSKKPFKQHLLSISDEFDLSGLAELFEVMNWEDAADRSAVNDSYVLRAANTLVMPHTLARVSTVPTNAGESAESFLAVHTGSGKRLPLADLLSQTSSLTLSVITDPPESEIDRIAHLFSIYGCPSLILLKQPFSEEKTRIADLLSGYIEMTPFDATAMTGQPFRPLYIGDAGMTPDESAEFARKNFIAYIKAGRSAFDQGNPKEALVNFEHAVSIASEVPDFSQYLPALYQFGRESAYQAGHLEKALAFAEKLTEILEAEKPDSRAHAEAMLTLGLIHARKSQYDRAVPVIETAVDMFAMLGADQKLAAAMKDLGVVLENATHYESALSRFQKAAQLSRDINDRQMLAAQHLNIGRIHDLRLNRYPESIQHYEKALALYKEMDNPEKTAEARLNIGRCYRLLGIFPKAENQYEKALSMAAGSGLNENRLKAKIIIEQANNAWFQGDFETAFKLQRKCHELAEQTDYPLLEVISKNTAGLIWWSLGNFEKSLTELEIALKQARQLDIRPDEIASTLNNIGLVHRERGDYEKALETFDQALAIDTELQSKWAMAYDYRNKGLTYLEMKQPETAVPLFEKAFELSNAIGNQINAAKARLGLGNALLALKTYESAKDAYSEALSLSKKMRIKETHWRALYGLGRVSLALENDREAAETYLRDAIDIIESMRSAIKVKELKENFMENRLDVYKDLVRLLADMAQPEAAFEIAERSRSRNFIDLLGTQRISLGSAIETELYDKQAVLAAEIEATEQLLAAAENAGEVQTYQAALKNLKNERQNLMLDIQAKHPRLSTLISIPTVSADKIVSRLETDAGLLSYYVLDDELLCWVLKNPQTGSGSGDAPVRLFRIPSDQSRLNSRVHRYRRIIQNLEPYETHSKELYDRLIAPVIEALDGIHTLGIIPHGSLHYLSFATLSSGENFLIDEFSLFYLPSASVLDYTLPRRIKRPKLQLQVLAIGNPDLENPALELPFAEQEVNSIHWNFPEITTLIGEKATEAWVVENIARFDIIHIASHGEFDPVNPLMSAIKLSRPAGAKSLSDLTADGNLRAAEVFGLDIRADMVCLSACQTGLGKVEAGDEIIGLNRSFFYAGTHTIISSLWRVSDVSTAMLIKTFYRRYTVNNKADSLRAAARHVKGRYPHPGYWGAFTLVGDFK
ncbi:MAG: tetratricopeptide repeat protein [Desulfobacterales bacterium]|nr:tetratricopeptide repeat protein [Desulfobacterales bacterium]